MYIVYEIGKRDRIMCSPPSAHVQNTWNNSVLADFEYDFACVQCKGDQFTYVRGALSLAIRPTFSLPPFIGSTTRN